MGPKQIKITERVTYWTCGAPTCRTRHTSEGTARRCPAASSQRNAERSSSLERRVKLFVDSVKRVEFIDSQPEPWRKDWKAWLLGEDNNGTS